MNAKNIGITKKFSLLLLTLILAITPLAAQLSRPSIIHAAGTGGIKGTLLPAGYVTQRQMKLAVPWEGMDEGAVYDVMRKAKSGQKVVIAFIGGSITRGTVSNGSRDGTFRKTITYTDYFADWWYKKFPKADLRFINAGISATDSYLGVHRVQKDVLDKKPDLVVVEYAVNDKKKAYLKQSYENLVRRIMDADSNPAVMLLFTAKVNGQSSQLQQAQIGKHYKLPMLSYANVMKDMISKGIYTMDELSGDAVHPSKLGSAVIGEILVRYLDGIYEKSMGQVKRQKAASSYVTSKKYSSAKVVGCKNMAVKSLGTFKRGTKGTVYKDTLTSTSGNGNLTFTVTGRNIGILFARQNNGKGGQFDVYVDGKKAASIDANYPNGRNRTYITAEPCYSSNTKKKHTVRIVRKGNSSGRELMIYGVLVSN